ncbi:MAG: DUF3566 domain-containing protein [Candidatus Nanopelagicales bacterium]|jgi:hypothetical protein
MSSTVTPGQPTPIGRSLADAPVRPTDATPAHGIPAVPPAPVPLMAEPPRPAESVAPEEVVEAPRRRAPRRARLYVYRLDAWSVMKVAFMLAVALGVVIVSAVAALWWLLDYSGVIATLARNVDEVIGSGTTTFDLEAVLAFDRVMGITVVVAALEVALVSILAGLFAVLYNLTVGITGGIEATFTDAV